MRLLSGILILLVSLATYGQDGWMTPNRGQWDNRILYDLELDHGNFFIEKDGFTVSLSNLREIYGHDHDEKDNGHNDELINYQSIKMTFINSGFNSKPQEMDSSEFYKNYILDNDPSKWKSWVYSYRKVEMSDLYVGIDLLCSTQDRYFEYSFRVRPNADYQTIKMKIEGSSGLSIDETGNLIMHTRFGQISHSAPVSWYELDGNKIKVNSSFKLEGDLVSFEVEKIPEGATLIIDPSLTFSTFTGSIVDNWGFTAAPDPNGNLFGGGIVFGTGYPLTTGAYDVTFNGGTGTYPFDIGITKFNATGNALIYSTYIGGSGNETPSSIVSSTTGELFLYGVTSSTNFPMAGTPYDNTHNGGPNETENNLNFNGADIYVARLNATGTALIASTYIGGSNSDGLNTNVLQYNYGDQFRGEIILDASNNVYVASTTFSGNFPVSGGMQSGIAGMQDAVVFKMPPTLSSLTWSIFFGGTGYESGNALEISSTGDIYFTGGTTSTNLPITFGNDLTANGGLSDGYLVRLNGTTGGFMSGTYLGQNEYDQAYFVQLDIDDKVYVLGQTQSSWAISPGVYGNPNSGQFIQKFSTNLTTIEWTTMIGAGTGNVEISPTAFLISDCYDIYLAGWGGILNQNTSYSQATMSTTNGFPVTSGPDNMAFQTNTNGSNFWIGVLGQDADQLKYATFMGGVTTSYNHVDGGTSRFDKSGRIYHAVCGACGGNDYGFTSTPGSWSPANPSPNCNLAAFKFELAQIEAIVSEPEPLICLPDPVIFNNNSANGNSFFWDFGDGSTSTEVNPVHYYAGPGNYTVTLVVADSNGCFSPDSVQFEVNIGDFQGGVIQPPGPICPGDSYQLEAFGGSVYSWSPAGLVDDPTSPTPYTTLDQTTTFTVVISDSCGIDTVQVTVPVLPFDPVISPDTSVCIGNSAYLYVSEGDVFTWNPSGDLNDSTIQNPIATPTVTTTYTVQVQSTEGCEFTDQVTVSVFYDPPIPVMPDFLEVCEGSSTTVTVSGGDTYVWSPNQNISATTGSTVIITPQSDMYYYCDFFNACGYATDSVFVDVVNAVIDAWNDTIICPGEVATIWATGGVSYSWSPTSTILTNPNASLVQVRPQQPTEYTVIGTDANGCTNSSSVFVDLYPAPFVQTSPDVFAFYGDVIPLDAEGNSDGTYVWTPAEFLSCVSCQSPTTSPDQNISYLVTFMDENGCIAWDSVTIHYDPILYIPNTFTPDGDEHNNVFQVIGSNIESFELLIYNRWGELIFQMNSFDDYWDGTYEGVMCQDGTYTWKIQYYGYETDEMFEQTGHINLIR